MKLSLVSLVTAAIGLTMAALSNTSGSPFVRYLPDPIGLAVATALAIFVGWLAWFEWFGSGKRLHRTKWIAVPVALLSAFTLFRFAMLFNSPAPGMLRAFPALLLSPVPSAIALCYVVKVFTRRLPATVAHKSG